MGILDKLIGKNGSVESDLKKSSSKTTKIKFLLSPTGKFNLGYSTGDVCEIESKQAQELIDAKYAEKA